jgi:hypothetical protein
MISLEDQIRDALRSEAGRLREVSPLRLLPAPGRLGPVTAPRRARRPWTWLAPVTAAVLVIALAIALVIVRTERNGPVVPARPQSPAPATFPRYYVALEHLNNDGNAARLMAGDSVTGKTLAAFNAPAGASFEGTTPAGAADDRTFVVAATLSQRKPPYPPWATDGPRAWYLLRLAPGSARPVSMTKLAIQSSAADLPVTQTALSADGRYLAVASGDAGTLREDLRVYSVATGQLVHAWTMVNAGAFSYKTLSHLSWVNGDEAVAFNLMWGLSSHQEVRKVAVSAGGTDLLAASRVVWSQSVPAPPHGVITASTPQLCGLATLTADGQAIVCWKSVVSAGNAVPPMVWVAYPLSSPAQPRVIARIPPPLTKLTSVTGASGTPAVYVSAHEVIGFSFVVSRGDTGPLTIHKFIASGGAIRQLGTGTIASMNAVW